jgi:hypothetical protein
MATFFAAISCHSLLLLPQLAKIAKSVKGYVVCVVRVMGSAQTIIVSRPGNRNDVLILEKPVNVLKGVFVTVMVSKNNRFDSPIYQIRRRERRISISFRYV